MSISTINNNESASLVRSKLNQTIQKANDDNRLFIQTTDPLSPQGNENDVVLNINTSEVFLKIDPTTWQSQGNIQGVSVTGQPRSFLYLNDLGEVILAESNLSQQENHLVRSDLTFEPSGPLEGRIEHNHTVAIDGGSDSFLAQSINVVLDGSGDWLAPFSRALNLSFNQPDGVNIGRFSALGANLNLGSDATAQEFRGTQIDINVRDNQTVTDLVGGHSHFISVDSSSTVEDITGFESFIDTTSGSSTERITGFTQRGVINGNTTVFSGLDVSPDISGSLEAFTGAQFSPEIDGPVGNFIGLNISPSVVSSNPTGIVGGITVNFENVNASDSLFTKAIGLNLVECIAFFSSSEDISPAPPDVLPFQFGNLVFRELRGEQSVNTDSVANVFGLNIQVEEDVQIGLGDFGLGLTNNLAFSEIQMGGGSASIQKLAGTINVLVLEEVESGPQGGTIDEAVCYRAAGLINPDSVTNYTVNEFTAFLFEQPQGLPIEADEVWGLKVKDPLAHNFLAGDLIVGGTSETPSNEDIALEIGDGRAVKLTQITESQRDTLDTTSGAGMIALVEDGSSPGLQVFNGFEWVRGSSPSVLWFSIPSDVTLDDSHSTRTAFLTGDAVITLPEWSSVSDGYVVEVVTDGGSHAATFATQGGDTVRNNRTQINGDCSVIRSPQTGLWVTVGEVTEP